MADGAKETIVIEENKRNAHFYYNAWRLLNRGDHLL